MCVWGGGEYYYSEWSGGGGSFEPPEPPLATGLRTVFDHYIVSMPGMYIYIELIKSDFI